jgi:hypothetical protein
LLASAKFSPIVHYLSNAYASIKHSRSAVGGVMGVIIILVEALFLHARRHVRAASPHVIVHNPILITPTRTATAAILPNDPANVTAGSRIVARLPTALARGSMFKPCNKT